jgi:hypothetical protein
MLTIVKAARRGHHYQMKLCAAGGTLPYVTVDLRVLAIAAAVLVSAPVAAQTQNPSGERVDRAKELCRLNHGVDCDKPEGLNEWLLQGRSREEAVRDGSRHPLPTQPGPSSTQPGPSPTQPGPASMRPGPAPSRP